MAGRLVKVLHRSQKEEKCPKGKQIGWRAHGWGLKILLKGIPVSKDFEIRKI